MFPLRNIVKNNPLKIDKWQKNIIKTMKINRSIHCGMLQGLLNSSMKLRSAKQNISNMYIFANNNKCIDKWLVYTRVRQLSSKCYAITCKTPTNSSVKSVETACVLCFICHLVSLAILSLAALRNIAECGRNRQKQRARLLSIVKINGHWNFLYANRWIIGYNLNALRK